MVAIIPILAGTKFLLLFLFPAWTKTARNDPGFWTEGKNTETVSRLIIQEPVEEHIGAYNEDSQCVDQHLDVWENLVGRDVPLCLQGVWKWF